ncbi:MAG: amino acid decarboxylase [Calditrichaeota bacterium]|nr:amino acid decarboxylase [Calditrichota bacterium]
MTENEQIAANGSAEISLEEFLKASDAALDWIANYFKNIGNYPVLAKTKPGETKSQLPTAPPENGEPLAEILEDFDKIIMPGITHWNHPRFFAYFSITGSAPGIIGELLSAALNVNVMLWKTSPSATELEEAVLNWLRQMVGLPQEFDAVINDTASVGSMCAMAAAREYANLRIREKGMAGRTDLLPLTVYTSDQAHSSIEKGAIILGIGQENVRKIRSNERFEMDVQELEQKIKQDIAAGKKPICAVATIGTTSTTSIDPVGKIAEICQRHDIWFHVDAAYGGAAAVLPEYQEKFRGWEFADSIIVNPHKWLFTPIDCSVLFCRKPKILKQAFSLVPEYLRTAEDADVKNYMDYGVALGRRFRALKLWMIIRAYGTQKIQQVIQRHIAWAQELAKAISNHPDFEMTAPTPFSTLAFRFHPQSFAEDQLNELNEKLLEKINATGEVFLSHTKLRGKFVLRLAIGNLKTTRDDIFLAWQIIQRQARAL